MSKSNTNRRRLSLLTSSAMAAACLLAGASGVTLAPTAALAANECAPVGVDPAANGGTADAYTCSGSQPSITYTTSGNLTLTMLNNAATTTGGVTVTGVGSNTVTINRSDTPQGAGDPSLVSTAGAGVQVTNTTGSITVNLTDPFGDTTDSALVVRGTSAGVALQTGAASGTAISLTTTTGLVSATGVTGAGIQTTTTSLGGGNTTMNIGSGVTGATAIRATSLGTGTITVNVSTRLVDNQISGEDIVGTAGPAIQITPNASATVTIGTARTVRASAGTSGVVDIATLNTGRALQLTINGGTLRSNDDTVAGRDDLAVRVGGGAGNVLLNNNTPQIGVSPNRVDVRSQLYGRVELANSGVVLFNNNADWYTAGASNLGSGATTFNNNAAGEIHANLAGGVTTLDFGAGADVFSNLGVIRIGAGGDGASTLVISGLETWTNNGGSILFGSGGTILTDGVPDDRLVATGAAFTGSGPSRMTMDVDFGAGAQTGCAAAVVADCFDLREGSTAGVSSVIVRDVGDGIGSLAPIALIDVSGAGTSAAGHFILDLGSDNYRAIVGHPGVIDAGLFIYQLGYDSTAQQHVLMAQPDGEALEFALLGANVQSIWQTTTGSWLERQVDLRDTLRGADTGGSPGVWVKAAGNFVDRILYQSYEVGGTTFEFNNSMAQDTSALVGGIDFLSHSGEGVAWVAGLTAGKVNSTVDFTTTQTVVEIEGSSLGAYATFLMGGFFVDGIVNTNRLDLEYESLGLAPLTAEVESLGYQAEAGYRLAIKEGVAFIEPLAALSHVTTDISEIEFPGTTVVGFDEMTSFRGAAGLRLGAGMAVFERYGAGFTLTGRLWNEFEGENNTVIDSGGASVEHFDDMSGTLGDLGVAVNFFSNGGGLSAFVDYGMKFKEDYQSTDVSAGLRFGW